MLKILALDIGDKWTGTAISDPLGMFARPYKTIETKHIEDFLIETIGKEHIQTIVVGNPRTMKGKESEQTKKVKSLADRLEKRFDTIKWELWDERLSSKRAAMVKKTKTKEDKLFSHSIAAAFILDSFLVYLQSKKAV